MSFVFETTDPAEAYAELSRHYNVRRFSVPEGRLSVSGTEDQVGPVGMQRLRLGMTGRLDAAPLVPLRLVHLVSGSMTYHRAGQSTTYGAGDLYLSTKPDVAVRADVHDAEMEIAAFDLGLLSEVAEPAPRHSPGPIHLTAHEPFTVSHAARWLATFRYVRDTLSAPLAGDQPFLPGSAGRLLAAATLSTFPNTAVGEDARSDRRDAHPETLRRAILFIDENAHRDISIADIAAGSYASIRSVQLAFRRHLDTTPLRYLRNVRLGRAHDELEAADPATSTVTAIAHRWGFSNLSRFAELHRATYGVPPASTLHR